MSVRPVWIGRSRRRCAGLMELLPSWAAFSVLAERAAPPASYATRERRLPSTAAAALGLCCLLAGQPLCHHERPEAAFFVARTATPASSSTRGRSFVHRRRRQHRNCERACRSTAPKTRARLPEFRASTKCLDFERALGRALDNFFTGCISAWSSLCIAAFGSLETRAATRFLPNAS